MLKFYSIPIEITGSMHPFCILVFKGIDSCINKVREICRQTYSFRDSLYISEGRLRLGIVALIAILVVSIMVFDSFTTSKEHEPSSYSNSNNYTKQNTSSKVKVIKTNDSTNKSSNSVDNNDSSVNNNHSVNTGKSKFKVSAPTEPPISPSPLNDEYIHGYQRKNGTYVNGYHRQHANKTKRDNYTYKGNRNPWTGETGHRR